jgi:hypothetical protein
MEAKGGFSGDFKTFEKKLKELDGELPKRNKKDLENTSRIIYL